ncbi:SH3 domain-containing protein [Aliiroseovarius sp. 2305UL8-7]|uniref:SH3 domain-containing protein n=1 Tax=Aliiroseovarius conchicola TaxID=3121637 RepID=UPI00352794DD
MGIIRLTLFTVGAVGAAMLHFGRDAELPVDRLGREPTIAQDTIEPVSAGIELDHSDTAAPAAGEVIATSNAATAADLTSTPRGLAVVPVTLASATAPQTAAEHAEHAARLMAASGAKPEPASQPVITDAGVPVVYVRGSTVNMRAGPSTRHGIVAKLTRGTEVIDMGSAGDGWSQIKVLDTGTRGFMASKFLTPNL